MASRVKGITIELNGDATGLDKALQSVNQNIIKTQSSLKDVDRLLKFDPGNTELLAQKQRLLAQAIEETKSKLETLKTAQQQAAQQLAEGKIGQEQYDALQREIAETEQRLQRFQGEADDTEKELREMGDAAGDAAEDTGELSVSLKSMIANAAVNLAVDGLKMLADKAKEAAKYVLKVGSSFEAGMSKVAAVSGASASDMEQLSAKAKEMGATTKFSASEAADAMNYMAMAGWKTNDMLEGIDGIMNLAAASGEALATTSDIVTDALTAFGETAEESGRLADIMAAASSNANTNVSMMGETFKYAAPVAGSLGATMEDTALAVGLMANSGIKASQAGTALRTGLSNLAKPTKQMKEWMDKYNISLVENEDGSVNLRETMVQLREKMGQLSETEQAAAASAIFGKNAMSGWMAIINSSDEDFNKLADAIDNSDGAAKEMMETMGENLQGKIKLLEASLEGLGIALYDKISGPLQTAVEAATGVLSGLTQALSDHRSENELVIDQIKEANDAVTASMDNAGKIQADAAAKAGQIDVLREALIKLNGQENLDEAQKARLKEIYDELVKLVPDMAGYYNEETGKIDLTTEAVKKLTKARKEEIIEQGRLAALQGIYEELGRAQAELQKAQANLNAMQKQKKMWEDMQKILGDARDEYTQLINKYGETADLSSLDNIKERLLAIAQAALNTGAISTETYSDIEDMLYGLSEGYSVAAVDNIWAWMQQGLKDTNVAFEEASQGMDALKKSYDDASVTVKNLEEATEGNTKATKEEIGVVNDSANSVSAMTDEKKAVRAATDDATESTKKSTKAISDETDSMDENKQASEDMRNESRERSKAESEARTGHRMTKEEIEAQTEAVHKAADAQKELRKAVSDARDDMRKAFEDIKKSAEDAFKINPFDQWSQDAEKGMLAFEEAMKSQRDGLLRYKDNLTTVKENLGSVAPEFVQYLEDMGQGGAQLVAEFADAFRTGNADVVYRLMDEYKQAMDIREDTANIIEQDKLALQLGLESLSPEAITAWEDLGYAFDEGVAVVQAKGGEVSQAAIESFWGAVDACKAVGIEAPAQLAEGIRNSEDPEQAIADATNYLTEQLRGRGQALVTAANELGIAIPAEIANTLSDPEATQEQVQTAVDSLVGMIKTKKPDFDAAGTEAGQAMGDSTASGISEKDADVTASTESILNNAKEAAKVNVTLFRMIGSSGMESYKSGMLNKEEDVKTAAVGIVSRAKETAQLYGERVFEAMGQSVTNGFVDGMNTAMQNADTAMAGFVHNVVGYAGEFSNAIEQMKASTQFYWNLPHLDMPHPWVRGRFSIDPPEVPYFGIDWYAKAMQNGMILNKPTIFGMQGNKFLAGGEAGSETIVGTNSLMNMIQAAVNRSGASFGDINIALTSPVTDVKALARELEGEISKNIIRRSGRF